MIRRLNLIKLRKETLGLTQHELATKIGVSASYVNAVEVGRKTGSIDFYKKLYDYYQYDNLWELVELFEVEKGEK